MIGLVTGSLLGTFLDLPRGWGWWDGAFRVALVLFVERITRWEYAPSIRSSPPAWGTGGRRVAFAKKGLLFAIFVDAFKVGS